MEPETFMLLAGGGGLMCAVGLGLHLVIFAGLLRERYGTRAAMVAAFRADKRKESDFVFGTFRRAHAVLFTCWWVAWLAGLGLLAAAAMVPVT